MTGNRIANAIFALRVARILNAAVGYKGHTSEE